MSDAPDAMMARIHEAMLAAGGDREAARARFQALWEAIGPEGDPLHRVALAHHMADVQDDPAQAIAWDERALAAADRLGDDRARSHHESLSVQAFYPSLHLNLAEGHRRLGDTEAAHRHLALGRRALDALPDDGYGRLIRGGLDRLAARLEAGDTGP
jgi:hypothetical protein